MTFARVSVVTIVALLSWAAPAAAADDVTQTDSPDPVQQGQNVTYSITVTNNFSEADELWLSTLVTKQGSDAAVDNPYVSIDSSQGSCAPDPPGLYGDYKSATCSLGTMAPGAVVTVTAVVKANHSMDHSATTSDCDPLASSFCYPIFTDFESTSVTVPPSISGSPKIVITGLPASCASSDFKLKAKAKPRSVRNMVVSLSGPRNENGGLIDGVISTSGRIGKEKGRKIKVPIDAASMDAGFYKLTFLALKKGGKLKTKVNFEVC